MNVPEIPDFDLLRPVGSGGFGEVWLARNRTTGLLRAVKLIAMQSAKPGNPAVREISSLTRLEANRHCRHENLLTIHHIGQTAEYLFYVMDPADDVSGAKASDGAEYQPATLRTLLDSGPLPAELCTTNLYDRELFHKVQRPTGAGHCQPSGSSYWLAALPPCVDYARQLLAGLAALHAAGMVHRDVKPANCLFVGGQLKLADFGLLTESNPMVSCVGTRTYMPPDGRMDARADVYAAGLVIYEMLTGLPADEFPRFGQRAAEIAGSPDLANLVVVLLKACEHDPAERFATAQEMLTALNKPAATAPGRSRRSMVAAVFLFIALALAAWMFFPTKRVAVSFITDPFEAYIFLDGTLQVDPRNGTPYRTPCTIDDLPVDRYRVAFQCEGQNRWEADEYDIAQTRQIFSRRPE